MALTPTIYNTGNALESNSAKDLDDNARFIDAVANDLTGSAVIDRRGNSRDSISKLESQYITTPLNGGEWAADIEFTAYNQYMAFNGLTYKVRFDQPLPYTTVNADATLDAGVEPFSFGLTSTEVETIVDDKVPTLTDLVFDTLDDAVNSVILINGGTVSLKERTAGNGGGAVWDVVLASTVTPNTFDIVQCISTPSLALVLRVPVVVNVLEIGADPLGASDSKPFVDRALELSKLVYIPEGTYLFNSEVTVPSGSSIFGDTTTKSSKRTIINCAGTAFKTDETLTGFAGIEIRDLRISGGSANKYAIESHYPYTVIERVYIEDSPTAYLGNGIRLHNDGGQGSMGCWGSRIYDCKITLTDTDPSNTRTSIEMFINGGAVEVVKCDLLLSNIAVNVLKGQAITLDRVNTNRQRDNATTSNTILSGAIILGTRAIQDGYDVQNCNIRDCYIEGYSRAVLINSAVNTNIRGTYFNDLGYVDPSSVGITDDGAIYHSEFASNTKIDSCYIDCRYNFQYIVFDTTPTNEKQGVSIENCYLFTNRGASGRLGGVRPTRNAKNVASSLKDTIFKSVVSNVTSFDKYDDDSRKGYRDINPHANATPVALFDIKAGETWVVQAGRSDNGSVFAESIVHKPVASGNAVASQYVTDGAMVISANGDTVEVTQSTGGNIRTHCYWYRTVAG